MTREIGGEQPRSETEIRPDNIPGALQSRDQWLLWDSRADRPKQPHDNGNFAVSWSDPDDWVTFANALGQSNQQQSWGVGYVAAANNDDHATGVVSVIDIDGGRDPDTGEIAEWVPDLDAFDGCYVEASPSETGIHIPVVGTSPPQWWSDSHIGEHEGVDVLSNKFCTVTGWQLEGSGDDVARWSDEAVVNWLAEAYERLTDQTAPIQDDGQQELSDATTSDYDDDWPDRETAEEMLDEIDPNCEYEQWRNIGFALADHFSTHSAKRLFDSWSRGASDYDDDAPKLIEDITSRGGGGVGIGTLVHHAEKAGWEGEEPGNSTPTPKELVARQDDQYDTVDDVPDEIFGQPESTTDGGTDDDETGSEDDPWWAIYTAYQGAQDGDERKGPRHSATNQLLAESHWRTVMTTDEIYHYDPDLGIYRQTGEADVRERLVAQLNEQYSKHEQNEVEAQLRGRTTVEHEDIGGPEMHICTENCVLEIGPAGEISRHDHSPEYDFLARVETKYDPDADAPRFQQFLDESVSSGSDKKKLQEFAGYALHHWSLPFHKSLFLVGPTASGKSTFLDTIRTMLGDSSVASLTPQQMTSERFGGAELFGKWANIRNDIPSSLIENTGQFKELIAGDPIKAEKKYEDPFMFEPTAKHMFSANELPEADVDDRAFYRRIMLVSFPHETPKKERDPRLLQDLQDEHAGILNWALSGLERLLNEGGFTGDRSPWLTEETWQKWADSATRFKRECLETDEDNDLATADVWEAYLAYCDEEGIPTKSRQQALTKALKRTGIETGRYYDNESGQNKRSLLNVSWSGRGEQFANDDHDGSSATGLDV
jgi:putative DNA primase/helicase